ncbi:MAG: hypothetical protein ACFCUH_08740 [Flavobacteriales bacterium]
MKNTRIYMVPMLALLALAACDRREEDLVTALSPDELPIVILISDEGDGDLEDADEVGIALELLPLWNAQTRNPEGETPEMPSDVTVRFALSNPEGFTAWDAYIVGVDAVYEIDDCTDSSDEGIDLNAEFDPSTGTGSFTWPQGVSEVEVLFELNPDLFANDLLDGSFGGFTFEVTGVEGNEGVRVSSNLNFHYLALDDEAVFGEWSIDPATDGNWEALQALFANFDEDFAELGVDEIDEIVLTFEYDKMEITIVLLATEEDECDPSELVNEEIQIEADYAFGADDLAGLTEGDLELEGAIEVEGIEYEFVLEGSFAISADGSTLTLELGGEIDDISELESQTLTLTR